MSHHNILLVARVNVVHIDLLPPIGLRPRCGALRELELSHARLQSRGERAGRKEAVCGFGECPSALHFLLGAEDAGLLVRSDGTFGNAPALA
jgi:hypothetical protein